MKLSVNAYIYIYIFPLDQICNDYEFRVSGRNDDNQNYGQMTQIVTLIIDAMKGKQMQI